MVAVVVVVLFVTPLVVSLVEKSAVIRVVIRHKAVTMMDKVSLLDVSRIVVLPLL